MPEISRFYGIVIQIYYGDHPPPHFHANYAGQVAKIDIDTLALIDGSLPARARGLVYRMGESTSGRIAGSLPQGNFARTVFEDRSSSLA